MYLRKRLRMDEVLRFAVRCFGQKGTAQVTHCPSKFVWVKHFLCTWPSLAINSAVDCKRDISESRKTKAVFDAAGPISVCIKAKLEYLIAGSINIVTFSLDFAIDLHCYPSSDCEMSLISSLEHRCHRVGPNLCSHPSRIDHLLTLFPP